jgi:3-hydroxyacyl-CoA dehydrogenase
MAESDVKQPVAIIGCGLIGRAWAVVFARAGHSVRVWDRDPAAMTGAVRFAADAVAALAQAELIEEPAHTVISRIEATPALDAALADAGYAQESVAEQLDVKRELFARLDALSPPGCILASSTSSIPASAFTADLPGRHRCLVAHPVNPPHLIPVVEIVPAPWTAAATVEQARMLLASAGQVPVLVKNEVDGFLVNRLQAALLREAWRLVGEGYCSVEDLDRCVRDGLGLRWALMGPFETIDLNAPGGIADYAARYGAAWHALLAGTTYVPWSTELVESIDAERRAVLPREALPQRVAWRDARLMALVAHVRARP